MIIGVPKEIKTNENRVGITPGGVKMFKDRGHEVFIQSSAGVGSCIEDLEYIKAGAKIVTTTEEIFKKAEMIIKVKEPLPQEYDLLKPGQIVYTYFHFASNKDLTEVMLKRKIIGIAYETVQTADGDLPLLSPMSEVAGKMAGQIAAQYLAVNNGGNGKLMGGVPGVSPAKVIIIGAGTAGTCAAKICAAMGGYVELFDVNIKRLRYLEDVLPKNIALMFCTQYELEKSIKDADVIIGTVYIPGAKAPKIVTEEMVKSLKPKTIIIDVCVDQGGCVETSRSTTHSNPIYEIYGVIHYCVANMPSAFPRTSTFALTNATLKYSLDIANKGYIAALREDSSLAKGLNVINGKITCKPVAEAHNLEYFPIENFIKKLA